MAGYLHRFFAVITFTYFALHLGYVARLIIRRRPGVFWGPDSMVPQPRDLVQLYQHVRYFLGLGPRPRFDRWAYWEKFDYWAVFWGIAIIGASGLLLWFPTFFANYLPGRVFNLAIIVHSDEALLAVGFIFMFHFFNANLRPEKFPMDPVIFTGRIDEEEFRRDHPAEYERLREAGQLERLRTDPPRALAPELLSGHRALCARHRPRPDLAHHQHGAPMTARGGFAHGSTARPVRAGGAGASSWSCSRWGWSWGGPRAWGSGKSARARCSATRATS